MWKKLTESYIAVNLPHFSLEAKDFPLRIRLVEPDGTIATTFWPKDWEQALAMVQGFRAGVAAASSYIRQNER